jgi:DNA-binding HxlR family transcriptional regulator
MKGIKRRSDCPISYALDIFGDKWSLLIIRDMMFKGKNTYGDFLKSEEKIATNILADRLVMLESVGLITGMTDEQNKSRKIYSLTAKAIALVPALIEIIYWSATYDSQTAAPKEFADRIKKDKSSLVRDIVASLTQS